MMYLTTTIALGLSLGMVSIVSGPGPEDFLKPDGTLKHPLSMTEERGGIAGPRVTIYSIKPDGTYTRKSYTRFVDQNGDEKKRGESTREGKLGKEKLGEIAKALASQKFVDLPKQIGAEEPVNPHAIIIDLGEKRTTCSAGAQTQPGQGADADQHWTRFKAVAEAIKAPIEAENK